jgi:hypothetical protein
MEQEITHYSRGKLHLGQITVRESAHSTKFKSSSSKALFKDDT